MEKGSLEKTGFVDSCMLGMEMFFSCSSFTVKCHEIDGLLNRSDGRIRNVSVMIELREWMTIGSKHRWNLKLTRC